MDLILISSNKLKVTLSEDEVLKYNIPILDGAASISNSKSIHTLLSDVQKMSGFDTGSDNLLIEIFESFDGGCEMFITKAVNDSKKTYSKGEIRELCQNCLCKFTGTAYIFNCTENLISACRALYNAKFKAYSSAYFDITGRYYLIIKPSDPFCAMDTEKLLAANEFGEATEKKFLEEYLSEYANIICLDNAIPTLAYM